MEASSWASCPAPDTSLLVLTPISPISRSTASIMPALNSTGAVRAVWDSPISVFPFWSPLPGLNG